jgi:hypothetical protein
MSTRGYTGGCHCGAVRFAIRADLQRIVECNCSICARKGALYCRVPPEDFTLESGADALTHYRFGSGVASHPFCRHCGIHAFCRPRSEPHMYGINVRCLDDYPAAVVDATLVQFDGQNWDTAIHGFRFR